MRVMTETFYAAIFGYDEVRPLNTNIGVSIHYIGDHLSLVNVDLFHHSTFLIELKHCFF